MHVPLSKWLFVIYVLNTLKLDMSLAELQRRLDVTYKTARLMAQKIRDHTDGRPAEKVLGDVTKTSTSRTRALGRLYGIDWWSKLKAEQVDKFRDSRALVLSIGKAMQKGRRKW